MKWGKVHCSHHRHPKIAPLSDKAFRFWFFLWGFCVEFETDGVIFVTDFDSIPRISRQKSIIKELVSARLLDPIDGGYKMHNFDRYQTTSAKIKDFSDKQRANGIKGGRPRKKPSGFLDQKADQTRSDQTRLDKNRIYTQHSGVAGIENHPAVDPSTLESFDELWQLESYCFHRFNQMGSTQASKLRQFLPILKYEVDDILRDGRGRSWGYMSTMLAVNRDAAKDIGDAPSARPPTLKEFLTSSVPGYHPDAPNPGAYVKDEHQELLKQKIDEWQKMYDPEDYEMAQRVKRTIEQIESESVLAR